MSPSSCSVAKRERDHQEQDQHDQKLGRKCNRAIIEAVIRSCNLALLEGCCIIPKNNLSYWSNIGSCYEIWIRGFEIKGERDLSKFEREWVSSNELVLIKFGKVTTKALFI